jgi:TPR repeat protein
MGKEVLSPPLFAILMWTMCVFQQGMAQTQASPTAPLSHGEIVQLQAKAQAGDPNAQLNLGRAYEDGDGVRQNDQLAVKWYWAAAERGNAIAQNNLGLMIRSGRGVEQDKQEAVRWYRKAAKQKNPSAMFNLGTAYYNGDGIGIDDTSAFAWFLLAQALGNKPAGEAVNRMNEEARNRQTGAFEKIGDMYEKGDDLPQSASDAALWYRKAANSGAASAQIKLASLLLQGPGGQDFVEARDLCEKAAKQQYPAADYCVGLLYQQGLGVERDLTRAAKWFTEAASLGHVVSMLQLGKMYWKGEGVKQDRISAYKFAYLAFQSELPQAVQEKEQFEREMTPKELDKGKAKALEWTRSQYHHPVMLNRSSSAPAQ